MLNTPGNTSVFYKPDNIIKVGAAINDNYLVNILSSEEYEILRDKSRSTRRENIEDHFIIAAAQSLKNAINALSCPNTKLNFDLHIEQSIRYLTQGRISSKIKSSKIYSKERILSNAIEYIRSHYQNKISAIDVANATNTSIRNLQYIFQEFIRLSPQEYLKNYRLFKFYKNLKILDNVSAAANESGLFHLGRASTQFNQYFQLKPSELHRRDQ